MAHTKTERNFLHIGERIRAARELRGLSVRELAKEMGCSRQALALLESGETTDPRALQIYGAARVLGVTAGYLLGLEKETSP